MKSLALLLMVLMFAGWSEAGSACKRALKKVNDLITKVDELKQQVVIHDVGPSNQTFVKLNSDPVCFGAKGNDYGQFKAAKGGKLRKIKLVHLNGYVACAGPSPIFWSHWGCGLYSNSGSTNFIIVALTNEGDKILFPPSKLGKGSFNWVLVPGYSSYSPELVMSIYDTPVSISAGQNLRLWYIEDLDDTWEGDNHGRACADIYGEFV